MFLLPEGNKENKSRALFARQNQQDRISGFSESETKKSGRFVFVKPYGEMVEDDVFYGNSA